jgi:undecaprenyl-diphosphatase
MGAALRQLDGNLLLWIQQYLRSPLLTGVMKGVTHLGDNGLIWLLLTLLLLIPKRTRRTALCMGAALVFSLLITNLLLKNMVARVRPYEAVSGLQLLIEKQGDWSFPSGHSSASFAAAVVCLRQLPRRFGVSALLLAGWIAFSRLYVGVHYPTDVLAGVLIGTVCAFWGMRAILLLENKLLRSEKTVSP